MFNKQSVKNQQLVLSPAERRKDILDVAVFLKKRQ